MIEETYPSGRVVRNFLDSDGGLSVVTSKAANGFVKRVASDFDYTAAGGVSKMKLGNGLWETTQLNERQQLTQVGLGTTNSNNNLFKIDYEYGELNTDGTTVDASKNIGMIAKTTTTIPATSFVQTFKYDAINRLTEAKEFNPTTPTINDWRQTFGYDRFGNRTQFSQTVGTTQLPTNNITHPTIDATNNQFTTGQGYVYDFNGNLIQDAEGRTFTFDGNDKQTEVRETNAPANQPSIGRYFYDASGARVKKVTNTETTIFVYDAGGALAAEYSTVAPPPNPTTSYLTTDHLGSPRVITDKNGQVISRRDFMPFGEELNAGVGGRTTANKYATSGYDNIRKRFTGYEKDDETNLDFAEARMYQNRHGRFTAVDPLLGSASAINPQTFNRYTYTGNNPINYTDPRGLNWCQNNSTGVGTFTGVNTPCEKGFTDLDGKTRTVSHTGCFTANPRDCHSAGSRVRFNPDGTTTLIRASSTNAAVGQGGNVSRASGNIPGQPASDAAESPAGGPASPSGQQAPHGALPLTCPTGVEDCNSGTEPLYSPPLDTSQNEPLQTVEDIKDAADLITLVPGANIGGATVKTVILLGQGNGRDALWELPNFIPFVKWFRKADNAIDAGKGAYAVYQGIDKSGAVKYVGITMRDPAVRFAEHLASGTEKALLKFKVIDGARGLTKIDARVLEQKLINKHGLNNLYNKINSIAQKYWGQYGIP